MERIIPKAKYQGWPCSAVALGCALHERIGPESLLANDLQGDGYLSLKGMNALIRANMPVKRYITFRRGERPTLQEFAQCFKGKAIICVMGHFVYLERCSYFSFFDNANDQVVAVWEL